MTGRRYGPPDDRWEDLPKWQARLAGVVLAVGLLAWVVGLVYLAGVLL